MHCHCIVPVWLGGHRSRTRYTPFYFPLSIQHQHVPRLVVVDILLPSGQYPHVVTLSSKQQEQQQQIDVERTSTDRKRKATR